MFSGDNLRWALILQGAKKVSFMACHSSKLLLVCTSPFDTVLLKYEFPKKLTCPLGELSTEFTSLIAKSTSPTTFFARCPTSVIIKPKPKSSGSGSGSNILNAFINCFTGTH